MENTPLSNFEIPHLVQTWEAIGSYSIRHHCVLSLDNKTDNMLFLNSVLSTITALQPVMLSIVDAKVWELWVVFATLPLVCNWKYVPTPPVSLEFYHDEPTTYTD